ncbi:MAG: PEP-CTERM sorting domain-containing protein [bacterium]
MARLRLVTVVAALCLVMGAAGASPLFGIHSYQEWQEALGGGGGGRIVPVPAQEFRDMVMGTGPYEGLELAEGDGWPDAYKPAEFREPTLEPIRQFDGEAGLYMTWGADGAEERQAAAWDYVYDEDPDLNGTMIEFSIFPPVESTYVSLNLIDGSGNYREWIWHAGDPGELPPGVWSTLVIDPVTGASNWPTAGGSPFIYQDPSNPFDLSSIQILRFNENIFATPGFPPGPGGNVPDGWVWNMWNHVEVTPEPTTMVLVGSGLLGLVLRRRRRKS